MDRFKKPVSKIPGKGGQRWYKNVGLGFKTPKEAIEGALNILLVQLQSGRGLPGILISNSGL